MTRMLAAASMTSSVMVSSWLIFSTLPRTVPRLLHESAKSAHVETSTERKAAIAELFSVRREVAGIATNLNQLARYANTEGTFPAEAVVGLRQAARTARRRHQGRPRPGRRCHRMEASRRRPSTSPAKRCRVAAWASPRVLEFPHRHRIARSAATADDAWPRAWNGRGGLSPI